MSRHGLLALAFLSATAAGYSAANAGHPRELGLVVAHRSLVVPVHGPVFLGCVYSRHECADLAHNQGYHHHWIRHDHYACPESPGYACFAK